jgi:hypothetical protein
MIMDFSILEGLAAKTHAFLPLPATQRQYPMGGREGMSARADQAHR